jgi:hypothetical protein
MRTAVRLGLAFWMVLLTCWGCAGSRDAMAVLPKTLNTVEPAKGFTKRVAVALTWTTPTDFGRRIGDIYYRALVDAMREQAPGIQLVTRTDGQWPDLLGEKDQKSPLPADAPAVAGKARIAGLNGWAWARVESLQQVARKTGILWFRKERYFIFAELSFSVYDPFTGAKLIDKVVETSTPVSKAEYDTMKAGGATAIADLDEVVADAGTDIGEQAAEVLEDQPWQAAVIGVQGKRIFLSAGASAGLRSGERLAVFAGGRMIQGQDGEQFVVPGPEVGLIEIVRVAEGVSEATVESASGGGRIQAGDIAAAVQLAD